MKYNRFYSNVSASYFNPTHHPMYLRSPLTGSGDLTWRQQYNGNWDTEKTILDSNNYKAYIPWIIDTMRVNEYEVTDRGNGQYTAGKTFSTNSWSNYMRLRGSNGNMILIQWGCVVIQSGVLEISVSFPTSFNIMPHIFTQAVSGVNTDYVTGALNSYSPSRVKSVSKTSAVIRVGESFGSTVESSSAFYWLGIG